MNRNVFFPDYVGGRLGLRINSTAMFPWPSISKPVSSRKARPGEPAFKQDGDRPRSHPGVPFLLPLNILDLVAGVTILRCGRADPVASPFQVESSRRAPLTDDR